VIFFFLIMLSNFNNQHFWRQTACLLLHAVTVHHKTVVTMELFNRDLKSTISIQSMPFWFFFHNSKMTFVALWSLFLWRFI
jgi:uncharacterized membrane protein